MKKLFVLTFLICSLTLLTVDGALAAVHNFTGDFSNPFLQPGYSQPSFEGWYYIEKDAPSATVRGTLGDDIAFGAESFQNDQSFINLSFSDPDVGGAVTYLKGSYLCENGCFVGLDYGDSQITFAPGYRLDLDENCYLAASLDYAFNHEDSAYKDSGIVAIEFNSRYYTTDSRVYGQLIIPNDDVTISDDIYIYAGGAYKYSDNIVLGANFTRKYGDSTFEIGCTTAFDELGLEARAVLADTADVFDCNALYSFTENIRAGLEIQDVENVDDPYIILKGNYKLDDQNSAILMYQLKNGDDGGVLYLRWDIALK
jgi:hypothetical protein